MSERREGGQREEGGRERRGERGEEAYQIRG